MASLFWPVITYWETVVIWMHKYRRNIDKERKKKPLDLMVFFFKSKLFFLRLYNEGIMTGWFMIAKRGLSCQPCVTSTSRCDKLDKSLLSRRVMSCLQCKQIFRTNSQGTPQQKHTSHLTHCSIYWHVFFPCPIRRLTVWLPLQSGLWSCEAVNDERRPVTVRLVVKSLCWTCHP